jgi:hypothetical protein
MKVIARVEKGIGHRLSPRDIVFQNLEQLAADCDQRRRKAAPHPLPELGAQVTEPASAAPDGSLGA